MTSGQAPNSTEGPRGILSDLRHNWASLTIYEKFEQIVTIVLTVLISLVVFAALCGLAARVVQLLLRGVLDPADHSLFQSVFGMILTVLIALEFNHSVVGALRRREGIVQARTVVLIALLALARKFIILDAATTEALTILALASAVLALGVVYWLVGEQDRKDQAAALQARRDGAERAP